MADGWVDETPSGGWCWETAAPGPELAAAVAAAFDEVESLSDEAWASLLKATSRLSGWASMAVARATVGVVAALEAEDARSRRPDPQQADTWATEEVAAALHVAPATASGRIGSALALVQRWPLLGEAVAAGRLSWAQGLVIAEGVAILDGQLDARGADLSDVAVDRVLLTAGDYPPARLRSRLASMVLALDPTAAARRRKRETRDRTGVGLWADPDGLATVVVRGAAPDAVAIHDAIHARAKAMKSECDAAARVAGGTGDSGGASGSGGDAADTGSRTIGQWRVAAVMAALGLAPRGMPPAPTPTGSQAPSDAAATGSAVTGDGTVTGHGTLPGGPADAPGATAAGGVIGCGLAPVQVRVTIDIATLLGLASDPGMLDGYGPIDPDLARQLAASGDWVRWVTDPVNGYLLDAGTRRHPGTALARYIQARDARCSHPTCGVRASRCDIDHIPEYRTTGHTRADQLTLTCPKHNRGRDAAGWTAEPAPWADPYAGPEPTWTTPLGQRYRSRTDPQLPDTTVPPGHVPLEHAPRGHAPPDDPPY